MGNPSLGHKSDFCLQPDTLNRISVKTNYAGTNDVRSHVKLTEFDSEAIHSPCQLISLADTAMSATTKQTRNSSPPYSTQMPSFLLKRFVLFLYALLNIIVVLWLFNLEMKCVFT